jgi:hypothetical protein
MTTKDSEPIPIDTTNEFMLGATSGHAGFGLGAYIMPSLLPRCNTRQQAYRLAAWLETMAEVLPAEPGEHTYEQIRNAIRNT